jgi:glutaredoxin
MTSVVVYSRPGCHLCEEAMEVVRRVQARRPFTLVERDIESDDALLRAYLERIPVVAVDGEELFQFFVDEDALERAVTISRVSGP